MAAGTPVYCMWCGGYPDERVAPGEPGHSSYRIVVNGPGVTICSDCIELVAIVVKEEREKADGGEARVSE